MKKQIILCVFSLITLTAFSQSKWFFSFSTGYGFGGPIGSIKKNMEKSHLNQRSPAVDFFGLIFNGSDYPQKTAGIPTLFKVGKRIKEDRSLYLEAGVSSRGEVVGHQNNDYLGNTIPIEFKVWQFTAGYQFSFRQTKSKWGIGPSVFVFNYFDDYKVNVYHSYTSVVPGLSLMARTPIGKEKRLIGVDLVAELNLAPPAKMKEIQKTTSSFSFTGPSVSYTSTLKESKVHMMHGMIGLALSIRGKSKNQ